MCTKCTTTAVKTTTKVNFSGRLETKLHEMRKELFGSKMPKLTATLFYRSIYGLTLWRSEKVTISFLAARTVWIERFIH